MVTDDTHRRVVTEVYGMVIRLYTIVTVDSRWQTVSKVSTG